MQGLVDRPLHRHSMTINSTTTIAANTLFSSPTKIDVLAVGGGGGGGLNTSGPGGVATADFGAGGGAGGAVVEALNVWVDGAITINVGAGGVVGSPGQPSSLVCSANMGPDGIDVVAPGGEQGGVPPNLVGKPLFVFVPGTDPNGAGQYLYTYFSGGKAITYDYYGNQIDEFGNTVLDNYIAEIKKNNYYPYYYYYGYDYYNYYYYYQYYWYYYPYQYGYFYDYIYGNSPNPNISVSPHFSAPPLTSGAPTIADLNNHPQMFLSGLNVNHVPFFGTAASANNAPVYVGNPGPGATHSLPSNGGPYQNGYSFAPFFEFTYSAIRNPGRGILGGATGGMGGGTYGHFDASEVAQSTQSNGLPGGVFADGAPATQFFQPFGAGGGGGSKGSFAAGGVGSYGAGNGASSSAPATAASVNSGGGGGGASTYQSGSAGGSGVVVISWED